MATRVAVCQILRCTLKNGPRSPLVGPLRSGRCLHHLLPPPPPTCHRLWCSSSSRAGPQNHPEASPPPPPAGKKPATELSLRTFTDMGFTEPQAEQLYEAVCGLRRGPGTAEVLTSLSALFVLGLNCSSVLKLLEKCPELYTVKEAQLQQRVNHLRRLGLVEGSLQRTVAHYPKILTVPMKKVKSVVQFLREKCLFTTQQLGDILRDSPAVVEQDLRQLEYQFQYVYFRLGIKQAEMVKCRLFRFPLDEVRCRHAFLERRGLYQTPDKKGQTLIINPKLDSILHSDRDAFLTQVAQATTEEYDVFQKLLAREWQEEEELQEGRIEADSDDDDGEEDDDDEDVVSGKAAYRKRRKR